MTADPTVLLVCSCSNVPCDCMGGITLPAIEPSIVEWYPAPGNPSSFKLLDAGTSGIDAPPRMHPADIEAIARRVVELLRTPEPEAPQADWLDALRPIGGPTT